LDFGIWILGFHFNRARKFAAAYTFSSTTQRGLRPFISSTIAAAAASLTCPPVSKLHDA